METLQLITCANRVATSLQFLDGFLHGEPEQLLTGHSINPDVKAALQDIGFFINQLIDGLESRVMLIASVRRYWVLTLMH